MCTQAHISVCPLIIVGLLQNSAAQRISQTFPEVHLVSGIQPLQDHSWVPLHMLRKVRRTTLVKGCQPISGLLVAVMQTSLLLDLRKES